MRRCIGGMTMWIRCRWGKRWRSRCCATWGSVGMSRSRDFHLRSSMGRGLREWGRTLDGGSTGDRWIEGGLKSGPTFTSRFTLRFRLRSDLDFDGAEAEAAVGYGGVERVHYDGVEFRS